MNMTFQTVLYSWILLVLTGTVYGQISNQADLDGIAKNIQIKVDVADNLQFNGGKHLFRVQFENKGSRSLSGTNWKIYFYSFFVIEADHIMSADGNYILPGGYVLEDSKLKINHAKGSLYSLSPVDGFPEISPNTTREITFFGANWAISKSDVPPNWYIVSDGLSPRVFESTSGNFVADFTEPNQWKRTNYDLYNPYTPMDRFERYKKINLQPKMKLSIPTPKEIIEHDDTVTLDMSGDVNIVHNNLSNEAVFLSNKTSFKIVDSAVKGAVNIHLTLDNVISTQEGYTLQTDPPSKEIHIAGKTTTGVFYGIQTLLSLLFDKSDLPKVLIKDEPRFGFRGMYVDISRNFHSKNTLLKLIDAMAMYKLNKLHIHLADDEGWRIEIKDLPELTEVGSKRCQSSSKDECLIPQLGSGPDTSTSGSGYLSIQEYKDLLHYAKMRHIEVIPEVDSPGHARAAIQAMESRYRKLNKIGEKAEAEMYRLVDPTDTSRYLSVQYFDDNAMSPCMESTFNFIDKVIKEIKAMHDDAGHPLRIYHFGGDEVARNAWSNSPTCQKLGFKGTPAEIRTSMKKLFAERVSNLTHTYGLNLLGWEDGFNKGNGIPFDRKLFPNTDVISNAWDNVWEWGEARRAYSFANAGYKVVMSHATHLYFDHPYEPDPEERGLYWAPRFTDTLKSFGYMPDNLYANIDVTRMGALLSRHGICGNHDKNCPSLQKPENIIGMQGHLWSETILTDDNFYYMIFPRMLAVAERSWHKAGWEKESSNITRHLAMRNDWDNFAHTIGKKELKRLDNMGIHYRVPPPGARVMGNKATVESEFRALEVEYSYDGVEWNTAPKDWNLPNKYTILLRTKSADGKRNSRQVKFNPVDQEMIDYLARELEIRFDVLDNLIDGNKDYLQRITISNKGPTTVLAGDWSVYFYHIRSINNLKTLPLPECGMVIEHVSGSLYKLTPVRGSFTNILPHGANVLECDFYARYWSVAITDNMPNWYVWSEGTEAMILQSTAGEQLNYVGPYDTKNKWKRYPEDQYDPFLPRTRYVMNSNVKDNGGIAEGTYVIPTPVKMTLNKNQFVTISHSEGWVVLHNDDFAMEVKAISEFYKIPISPADEKTKVIKLQKKDISVIQNGSKTEAYHLDVTSSNNVVSITANDNKGAYYAVQTLKRLSVNSSNSDYKVYENHIEDEPRFEYRGLFLDVGRNFHTKDEIKTILDAMSIYKLNRFLFHLSEDEGWRLEIPGLEELTKVGSKRCHDLKERTCTLSQLGSGPNTNNSGSGYYTVDDYKEILTYANDRNIKVIPEFDMPGHARAAIVSMKERNRIYELQRNSSLADNYLLHDPDDQSEYMSVQWFVDNAINPCIDTTYNFIDHVVTEVNAMHAGIQDLEIFSFGGDEVAKGAWERSPKCIEFMKTNAGIKSISDIKEYFAGRVGHIVGNHGLDISAWEDGLMHGKDPFNLNSLVPNGRKAYTSTWDNVWEFGGGDRSYRMANAGYKVILALATHLYFDHPYEPDPAERGYYWATRYTDTRKSFGFIPGNVYANADVKSNGSPLSNTDICGGETCYQLTKPENIIGMMGLVWTETTRTKDQLQDRFFPRILAVAERAWHKSPWEDIDDIEERSKQMNDDWILFANRLGYRELKYLDGMGIKYRVPVPGAKKDGDVVKTNTAFPGLVVEHRKDNQVEWKSGEIDSTGSKLHLRTKSADGSRTSRVVSMSLLTSAAEQLIQSTFMTFFIMALSFILIL